MKISEKFFESELYPEMYEAMRSFLTAFEIREGKFEGNEVILNKLNRDNVIVYKEYELQDGTCEYSDDSYICNIDELVEFIDHAMKVIL